MAKDADDARGDESGRPTGAPQSTNAGKSTEKERKLATATPESSVGATDHPQPLQAADYVREGTWHGLAKWECKLCPWDTMKGEDVAIAHVVERHMPPESRTPVLNLPRFNRFGEEIEKED